MLPPRIASFRAFLLFSGLISCSTLLAQDDFDKVEITSTPVAGKVHMLMGQGGNIAVSVGADGVLMVDDQFAPLADKIRTKIRELGGDAPTFLLNTHYHGDHSGGNEKFADSATIIAHDNVRLRMEDPANGRVPESLPVITYGDNLSIHFNGEEIRLIHLPAGHTDGDSAIWFTGSNVLHMGDQFFAVRFPFVDLESGGSVEGLVKNLDMILALLPDDIQIIPGHGALATKADFATYVAGVKDTVGIIQQRMARGMNLETLIEQGLPDQYDSWGRGFISEPAWITAIYDSSTRN